MEQVNANVAISMIYGDTLNLDENIQESFENVGVSHLMSVSGTHITSFMVIINMVLGINKYSKKDIGKYKKRKINKNSKKDIIKLFIQIFSIWLYMLFTGFSVSVLRAGIMLIISIICDVLNKRKNKYQALLATFLIILFQNPFSFFNIGMRLSFLATLGIILFGKYIEKLFARVTRKIKNEISKKIVKYITQSIAITIAVQLLIIPIQINAFNKLPFPVIIPNLVLGLVASIIRVIGTFGIMLSFIPVLSFKIFSVLEIFVKALIYLANIFKMISFNISTVSQPLVFVIIYYMLIVSIFIYFKIKNIINEDTKYNLKKLLKNLKLTQTILCVLLITMLISLNVYSVYFSEYVYFFNVGQGDMSYIKSGKTSIIVDIGSMSNNLSFNTISNYFKICNLNKVDAIVISHMHKDHINGLENFIQNYGVGTVIYAKPKEESAAYQNFKEILIKYKIKGKEVKAGDVINIGIIKIHVLLPGEEYIDSTDAVNANSLICKITVNDKHLLYMGDASKEAEEKLIKENNNIENIYILKVGHHGLSYTQKII